MNWDAIVLSLRLAATVSIILGLIGLPVAYWLAFSAWKGKFLVEALVALPLVLPPTVLGYYVLVITAPHTLLGRAYEMLFGRSIPFTFEGLVVGSVLYSLPFAVQPFTTAFASVNPRLIKASSVLGASRRRTFYRVILPLSVNGVITGIVLSFAHTLGEFGVVLMLGGNIPGVTRTISIDIYDKVQAMDLGSADSTALALLIFSFVVLTSVYALNRNWLWLSKWQR